jgi:hypothetical protein
MRKLLLSLSAMSLLLLVYANVAQATWGPQHNCSEAESSHCYALAERNIGRFGGVLASIAFENTTYEAPQASVPNGRVSNEEWISFPSQGVSGWIETGQVIGEPYGCCSIHPFYAENQRGVYRETLSPGTVPANTYNHYVLYDPERNGRWRIYWGCCEVGSYGGGWPAYLTEQEAGIETATATRPYEWGRQEVAASNGGEWTPWSGANWYRNPGICMAGNEESSAAGNIQWGTLGGPPNTECA